MNRITRRLAGAAAAALAVTTLSVATSAPAHAATCATTVKLTSYKKVNVWSEYNSLSASTSSTCGTPYAGKTHIQRSTNGGKTWSTIATGGASYASFYGSGKFNKTALYRARYSGGSNSSGSTTWTADTSAARRVGVIRKVSFTDKSTSRRSVGKFAIKPAASIRGKYAKFQRKANGSWRRYKKVKVGRTGVIKVTFKNSRRGIKYRMVLPQAKGMLKSTFGPITARRY